MRPDYPRVQEGEESQHLNQDLRSWSRWATGRKMRRSRTESVGAVSCSCCDQVLMCYRYNYSRVYVRQGRKDAAFYSVFDRIRVRIASFPLLQTITDAHWFAYSIQQSLPFYKEILGFVNVSKPDNTLASICRTPSGKPYVKGGEEGVHLYLRVPYGASGSGRAAPAMPPPQSLWIEVENVDGELCWSCFCLPLLDR